MRSNSSSVAGWLVPARGTCSRKLSSPSASTNETLTPCCASASDRQSPTGPAPMTTTRSDCLFMPHVSRMRCSAKLLRSGAPLIRDPASLRGESNRGPGSAAHHCVLRCARDKSSALRHDVLDGALPALVGQVEHDAERVLVLALVERVG